MEIVSRKLLASRVAGRWRQQYEKTSHWSEKENIYRQLLLLGTDPEPDEVDKVIGNGSWTRTTCNECNEDQQMTVMVGQRPDYDSATAWICVSCLKKAIELAGTVAS